MKARGVGCGLLCVALVVAAQAAATQAPSGPAAARPASAPDGNLAQLMRAIMFPNSNIIFNVQGHDPAAPKAPYVQGDAAFSWTEWGTGIYTGWEVVENAAIALGEAPDLIMKSGRVCSNGKPAPIDQPAFIKGAQALRDAARLALRAAQEKSQQKVAAATDELTEACLSCHLVYRNTPPGGPERCVARVR